MRRGHLPYRGEPQPKYPKPKRQIRNIREENYKRSLTVSVLGVISFILLMALLSDYQKNGGEFPGGELLFLLVFGAVIVAISDGLKKINKFRKGYDMDISKREHDSEREIDNG